MYYISIHFILISLSPLKRERKNAVSNLSYKVIAIKSEHSPAEGLVETPKTKRKGKPSNPHQNNRGRHSNYGRPRGAYRSSEHHPTTQTYATIFPAGPEYTYYYADMPQHPQGYWNPQPSYAQAYAHPPMGYPVTMAPTMMGYDPGAQMMPGYVQTYGMVPAAETTYYGGTPMGMPPAQQAPYPVAAPTGPMYSQPVEHVPAPDTVQSSTPIESPEPKSQKFMICTRLGNGQLLDADQKILVIRTPEGEPRPLTVVASSDLKREVVKLSPHGEFTYCRIKGSQLVLDDGSILAGYDGEGSFRFLSITDICGPTEPNRDSVDMSSDKTSTVPGTPQELSPMPAVDLKVPDESGPVSEADAVPQRKEPVVSANTSNAAEPEGADLIDDTTAPTRGWETVSVKRHESNQKKFQVEKRPVDKTNSSSPPQRGGKPQKSKAGSIQAPAPQQSARGARAYSNRTSNRSSNRPKHGAPQHNSNVWPTPDGSPKSSSKKIQTSPAKVRPSSSPSIKQTTAKSSAKTSSPALPQASSPPKPSKKVEQPKVEALAPPVDLKQQVEYQAKEIVQSLLSGIGHQYVFNKNLNQNLKKVLSALNSHKTSVFDVDAVNENVSKLMDLKISSIESICQKIMSKLNEVAVKKDKKFESFKLSEMTSLQSLLKVMEEHTGSYDQFKEALSTLHEILNLIKHKDPEFMAKLTNFDPQDLSGELEAFWMSVFLLAERHFKSLGQIQSTGEKICGYIGDNSTAKNLIKRFVEFNKQLVSLAKKHNKKDPFETYRAVFKYIQENALAVIPADLKERKDPIAKMVLKQILLTLQSDFKEMNESLKKLYVNAKIDPKIITKSSILFVLHLEIFIRVKSVIFPDLSIDESFSWIEGGIDSFSQTFYNAFNEALGEDLRNTDSLVPKVDSYWSHQVHLLATMRYHHVYSYYKQLDPAQAGEKIINDLLNTPDFESAHSDTQKWFCGYLEILIRKDVRANLEPESYNKFFEVLDRRVAQLNVDQLQSYAGAMVFELGTRIGIIKEGATKQQQAEDSCDAQIERAKKCLIYIKTTEAENLWRVLRPIGSVSSKQLLAVPGAFSELSQVLNQEPGEDPIKVRNMQRLRVLIAWGYMDKKPGANPILLSDIVAGSQRLAKCNTASNSCRAVISQSVFLGMKLLGSKVDIQHIEYISKLAEALGSMPKIYNEASINLLFHWAYFAQDMNAKLNRLTVALKYLGDLSEGSDDLMHRFWTLLVEGEVWFERYIEIAEKCKVVKSHQAEDFVEAKGVITGMKDKFCIKHIEMIRKCCKPLDPQNTKRYGLYDIEGLAGCGNILGDFLFCESERSAYGYLEEKKRPEIDLVCYQEDPYELRTKTPNIGLVHWFEMDLFRSFLLQLYPDFHQLETEEKKKVHRVFLEAVNTSLMQSGQSVRPGG